MAITSEETWPVLNEREVHQERWFRCPHSCANQQGGCNPNAGDKDCLRCDDYAGPVIYGVTTLAERWVLDRARRALAERRKGNGYECIEGDDEE